MLVNAGLVDRVLDEHQWVALMNEDDRRGLSRLFWSIVALHGTFEFDLDKRLDL